MNETGADDRVFVSYATPDESLANALIDFLRLGCDLREQQIFSTSRPSAIPAGTQFAEVIRDALDGSAIAILLLTPSYYESRFCLAEAGAVWMLRKHHVPLLVPPVDYHDLEGVQLGEQALRIDSASDLDDIRDRIMEVIGTRVATGGWNKQKENFLNEWASTFDGQIAQPASVSADEHLALASRLEAADRTMADLTEERDRLRRYTRELKAQNDELRSRVPDPPAPPALQDDEIAQWKEEAASTISRAKERMDELPRLVCEALFQYFHDGRPLTGTEGFVDRDQVEAAQRYVEDGYLAHYDEGPDGGISVRHQHPDVGAAVTSLREVREVVFGGSSLDTSSEAPDEMKAFLKENYGIVDPTFELRPVWESLGFLPSRPRR